MKSLLTVGVIVGTYMTITAFASEGVDVAIDALKSRATVIESALHSAAR